MPLLDANNAVPATPSSKRKISDVDADSLTVEEYLAKRVERHCADILALAKARAETLTEEFRQEKELLLQDAQLQRETTKKARKATSRTTTTVRTKKVQFTTQGGPYGTNKVFTVYVRENEEHKIGRSSGAEFKKSGISLAKDDEVSTTHGKVGVCVCIKRYRTLTRIADIVQRL